MSIFMWSYPLLLFILARIIYKTAFKKPKLAYYLLAICFILFYLAVLIIAVQGFNFSKKSHNFFKGGLTNFICFK